MWPPKAVREVALRSVEAEATQSAAASRELQESLESDGPEVLLQGASADCGAARG